MGSRECGRGHGNHGNLSRINGYVGRKFSPSFKNNDNYLTSTGKRTNYQLEPAVVSDNENTVVTYDDFLHFLENNGVSTANQNKLFNNYLFPSPRFFLVP